MTAIERALERWGNGKEYKVEHLENGEPYTRFYGCKYLFKKPEESDYSPHHELGERVSTAYECIKLTPIHD